MSNAFGFDTYVVQLYFTSIMPKCYASMLASPKHAFAVGVVIRVEATSFTKRIATPMARRPWLLKLVAVYEI